MFANNWMKQESKVHNMPQIKLIFPPAILIIDYENLWFACITHNSCMMIISNKYMTYYRL